MVDVGLIMRTQCVCVRVGAGACSQGGRAHAGLRLEPAQQERAGTEGPELMHLTVVGRCPGTRTCVLQVSLTLIVQKCKF